MLQAAAPRAAGLHPATTERRKSFDVLQTHDAHLARNNINHEGERRCWAATFRK